MMNPISISEINSLPGVIAHFQTDDSFIKNYASDDSSNTLGDLSPVCLNFAQAISAVCKLGQLNKITVYNAESKFVLQSLSSPRAYPPGPRLIGLKVSNDTNLKSLSEQIRRCVL